MKPLVNLASEPYRNRRLFWLAIIMLFAIPSYLGLNAIEAMTKREMEISTSKAVVGGLEAQIKKVQKPVVTTVTISPDQNRELAAASDLIARKAFSWSQLLTDIERNLPPNVRVMRVTVSQILQSERDAATGLNGSAATLMIEVIGKSNQDVTNMINRFHETGRFKVLPLTNKVVEGTEEKEFTLKVEYFPPQTGTRSNLSNQIAEKIQ